MFIFERIQKLVKFLQALKKEAVEKLATFCKGPEYPNFVRKLIVQGLIKIEEQEVEIQCRPEDKTIVTKVVSNFRTCCYSGFILVAISYLMLFLNSRH